MSSRSAGPLREGADRVPPTTPPFSVSVVTNTAADGKTCKVCRYDEASDGVVSETHAYLSEGRVKQVSFDTVGSFMTFRASLKRNTALMMGKPLYAEARIVTQAKLKRMTPESRKKERIIARDRAHVSWSDGPTLVMLDLDHPDRFPDEVSAQAPTTPDEWRQLLTECLPGLAEVQMGWAPSSSSYIYLEDRELHGLRGQRYYFVIDCGQEVPRIKQALHDALVLRGFVWHEVSKSGSLLERLPFDLTVFQPERLDFAAGPECAPPLEWRPPEPQVWNDGGAHLKGSDLPTTTDSDRRRIDATLREARRVKQDEARARRDTWRAETVRKIALSAGVDSSHAETVAEAALEREVLLPEFLLTDSNGQTVSVGELLKDPATHHGRRFRDPLEPDYRNDPRIAVFLVGDNGEARIYSHAHGGQSWKCQRSIPVVRQGLIHETVDQITKALELDDCGLYRNGDALVWVNEADARMRPLDVEGLGLRLQRRFDVVGQNRNGNWVPRNLTLRTLKALLSEASRLPVRNLNAVVRGPFALADGTVIDVPGYDPVSEVVYVSDSVYPPRVRQQLSIAEAEEALRELWFAVHLFPLKTDVDRGVLLAALLSTVVRPSILIAPGYYFTAHTPGTGKTLLAQLIGLLQTGHPVAASPLPGNEEERRKHIFASLRQGMQYLLYDNTDRGSELDSAVLANLITSPLIEGRVLGISNVEQRPNRLTIALTGNNLTMHGDLNRRILPVTLDAAVEYPWQREFAFHPVDHVRANWLPLRIAALELIQACRIHGAPKVPGSTGFPEWDAVVRSVVCWVSEELDTEVGFADPAEALRAAYVADPETDVLGSLLAAWYAVFEQREVQLKDVEDVVSRAEVDDPIIGGEHGGAPEKDTGFALAEARRAALETIAGQYDQARVRLGMYLAKHEGRIVGGLKLVKGGKRGGARKWRVAGVTKDPVSTRESEVPSVEDLI